MRTDPRTGFLRGIVPALVTPFTANGEVDHDGVGAQVRFQAGLGVSSVALFALVGEGFKLSDAEREAVVRSAVEAAGDLPVVVAVDHNSPEAAAARAARAAELGAAGLMALPPSFQAPGPRDLVKYYGQVARAGGIPLIVQDAPRASGVSMSVPLLEEILSADEWVVGFKVEAPPVVVKILEIRKRESMRDAVLIGGMGGRAFLRELRAGASGTMIGPAFPEPFVRIAQLAADESWEEAERVFGELLPLLALTEGNDAVTHGHKLLFESAGVIESAYVRAPTVPLDPITTEAWLRLAKRLGLAVTRDR